MTSSKTLAFFEELARDPRRQDDVDSRGPDHAADACRYALGRERPRFEEIRLGGYW